ncbi:MAG TPA: putative lipid II flippase FtsW [Myxococcota bacterium]|nr:putative lipid II flippase FtsW [Myxococcota bacterium]
MRIPGTLTLPSASGGEREGAARRWPGEDRGADHEERPREPLLPASDGSLLSAAAILTGIGIVMIYSLTAPLSQGSPLPVFFVRHLEGVAAGIVCAVVAFRLPLGTWRRIALPAWAISVALLVLTQAVGVRTNGAQRWLAIPGTGISFQPVEIAKLATLLVVAQLLARHEGPSAFRLRNLVLPLAAALVPAALLVLQPDLGNAVVLLALTGALLFAAGAPLRFFALPALVGALGVTAYVMTHPYAGARITSFLRPWETSGREGYQLVQSFVAFGRGHVLGVGVGAGRQKLAYLPEAHTDFVLAGVAEELGLVGVLVVIGGFAALLLGGMRIARRARDRYSLLVAFATTLFLTFPAAINAAVVMGLLPTKGLAMPFLSYGRSATLACFLALGILLGIARREAAPQRPTIAGAERRGLLQP